MKKTNVLVSLFSLSFLLLVSIGVSDAKPINIVIILDTSNRVSEEKHPGQIERDKEIIAEIVTEFENAVKKHIDASEYLRFSDRLTLAIPTQPGVRPVQRQVLRKLTIVDRSQEHTSLAGIIKYLEKRKQVFLEALNALYTFVGQHRQTGADIWEWFKYEAESYFLESHRNIVVCISDGYLNFDKNIEARRIPRTYMHVSKLRDDPEWEQKIQGGEGLLPIGKDFGHYNIDFLMSEIQLLTDKNGVPYQKDFQIIVHYWDTWLRAMNIQSTDFGKVGHPVGQKIKNLIETN